MPENNFENIPAELRALPQFVLWREVQKPGEPKPRKVPLDPQSARFTNVHEPKNWLAFDQACTLARARGVGIGFVLTAADPFACIDLDGCIAPDGALSPLAQAVVAGFPGAWVERSHSGKGLHIWIKGTVPDGSKTGTTTQSGGGKIEAYSAGRFIALTGVEL